MRVRLPALALLLSVAVACTPEAPPTTTGHGGPVAATTPVSAVPAGRWRAVLIAGDDGSPAFDNGVQSLREKLGTRGVTDIAVLSADAARVSPDHVASGANVVSAIGARGQEGACLVFITSHGTGRGIYLAGHRLLTPAAFEQALLRGCGALPTVVVMSACHSGVFLTPVARRPNRVIMTAAAADRTSFGCGAGDRYTYYDQCLLRQFDGAATWRDLAAATRSCVETLERRTGVPQSSEPQAFFGAEVAGLRLP